MTNPELQKRPKLSAAHVRGLAACALGLALLCAVISCRSVHRAVVVLPNVPGAKYIGSKECEQCHDQLYRDFQTADHARLIAQGPNALSAGCESCHGPCSLHSDSGGETKPPFSYTAGRPAANSFGARIVDPPARSVETVCFQCHSDIRGKFSLPSHHPVTEGKMSCTDCHPPHKSSVYFGGGTSLLAENESCFRCHPSQRGPYAFEHEALREGCTACHTAHGSVNAKMLTERDSNLCLKCHFQQIKGTQLLIGGSDHSLRVRQGSCWTAGCHEAVHGSRVSPSLRF
ncbi:MAG TPA: cytochrome c3 family protein [Verrucomicrobiae bacterium]